MTDLSMASPNFHPRRKGISVETRPGPTPEADPVQASPNFRPRRKGISVETQPGPTPEANPVQESPAPPTPPKKKKTKAVAQVIAMTIVAMMFAGCAFLPGDLFPVTPPAEGPVTPPAEDPVTPPVSATFDEMDPTLLQWFGTPNHRAAVYGGCRIAGLKMTTNGLSFRYVSGGCEALGAPSAGNFGRTQACLGYRDAGGVWRIAKFDWISTSRTTRDFKNMDSGYNGWPPAWRSATEYCFVICGVTTDGGGVPNNRRSNIITWRR